ncbi:MAG: UvrB/UvrC motif-containing protein [Planctomycetota bacterium]|jgi:protein arginine kinase activator|nr:UvrB/UvrC motif-containing protein [Planctomycetota bacterium]
MKKICESCKKAPASVHLTDIKNNVKSEMHLCAACAAQKGVQVKNSISLQQLFGEKLLQMFSAAGATVEKKETDEAACPHCGLTWSGYRENGRLGCYRDYEIFADRLRPLLYEMHGSPGRYVGKSPHPNPRTLRQQQRLEHQRLLKEAIAKEDYRTAARLRDNLAALGEEQFTIHN